MFRTLQELEQRLESRFSLSVLYPLGHKCVAWIMRAVASMVFAKDAYLLGVPAYGAWATGAAPQIWLKPLTEPARSSFVTNIAGPCSIRSSVTWASRQLALHRLIIASIRVAMARSPTTNEATTAVASALASTCIAIRPKSPLLAASATPEILKSATPMASFVFTTPTPHKVSIDVTHVFTVSMVVRYLTVHPRH